MVYRAFRVVLLRVGQHLLAVPVDYGRLIWKEMGHDKLWRRLHGEGIGHVVCRSWRRLVVREDRVMEQGILGDDRMRPRCRFHGVVVAEAPGRTNGEGFTERCCSSGRPSNAGKSMKRAA